MLAIERVRAAGLLIGCLLLPALRAYGQQTYADNEYFVVANYVAVLARDPEIAGYAGWLRGLYDGAISRPALTGGFLGSPEFQLRTAAFNAGNGHSCSVPDLNAYNPNGKLPADNARFVAQLYLNILQRCASNGEIEFQTQVLYGDPPAPAHLTRLQMVDSFMSSPEFHLRFGARINAYIVNNPVPLIISLSPASEVTGDAIFTARVNDTGGSMNLDLVRVEFNGDGRACRVLYRPALNVFSLQEESGATTSTVSGGLGATIENSRCRLTSSVTPQFTSREILLQFRMLLFPNTFGGPKDVVVFAQNRQGQAANRTLGAVQVPGGSTATTCQQIIRFVVPTATVPEPAPRPTL